MGTLQVSFRCVENRQTVAENTTVCWANALYENTFEIPKAAPGDLPRAVHKMKPPRTTREYLEKQIRKKLKKLDVPERVLKANIVIIYMWDEYALAENGSLS